MSIFKSKNLKCQKLNNAYVLTAELSQGLKGRFPWNVWKGRRGGGMVIQYKHIPYYWGKSWNN